MIKVKQLKTTVGRDRGATLRLGGGGGDTRHFLSYY